MEEMRMTCKTCFCSQETYDTEEAYGKNLKGEIQTTDLHWPYCYCYAEPAAKLVSDFIIDGQAPDVMADPDYYRCGLGRWWEKGRWARWTDREEETE